jgi:hypothetical protein
VHAPGRGRGAYPDKESSSAETSPALAAPHFVHFAGHGGGEEGSFAAENDTGYAHVIPVDGLVQACRSRDAVAAMSVVGIAASSQTKGCADPALMPS